MKPDLTLGIISDIHIGNKDHLPALVRAFEHFRGANADGVVISGDMADTGLVRQLHLVSDAWFRVFPGNKAPDGHTVEKLFIYGNHDLCAPWGMDVLKDEIPGEEERKGHVIAYDQKRHWEEAFKEPWEGIYAKNVCGYVFIGAHWGNEDKLESFLAENEKRLGLKSGRPFFYAQHAHPGNTVNGPWAWGNDGGSATAVLSKYPNAVAISGHSHYSLTDERSIWQGSFTSIGASSLRYIFATYWRENGDSCNAEPVKEMPCLDQGAGKQGMVMRARGNLLSFERWDFVNGEKVGEDWIVPIDGKASFSFEKRKKDSIAPQFGDSLPPVSIRCIEGSDRKGNAKSQVEVLFPSAMDRPEARVYDYEVQALRYCEDVDYPVATKRVLSENFFLSHGRAPLSGRCLFSFDEIPGGTPLQFKITPIGFFGKRGEAIYSDLWSRPERI